MDFSIEGVEQFNRLSVDLGRSAARAGARAALVVRKSAADIERDAKAFAPVETGNLRNSIGSDIAGDGRAREIVAVIGPTASYGGYVEFGTSRMAPHAYMGPAADRHFGTFTDALAKIGEEILG